MDCKVNGCVKAVFRVGLCHRHYDDHRKESAPLCKIEGCSNKSERVGMCNRHYRQQKRSVAPECTVDGCGRPQTANGYCTTHNSRIHRHGSLEADKRAHDRGARAKHPLSHTWYWHSRHQTLCPEWQESIWAMEADVGERPSSHHRLRRLDISRPIGPGNWMWKETIPCENHAAYAREWRNRNLRNAKSSSLKKQFGITIHDYERMAEEQNHVCAICHEQEFARAPGALTARYLAVDHCHKTGRIRGLVCSCCNLLIGKYEKYPHVMENLVAYMHKHST